MTYSVSMLGPGLSMFRCETHACTMSMTGCAARWRKAQAFNTRLAVRAVYEDAKAAFVPHRSERYSRAARRTAEESGALRAGVARAHVEGAAFDACRSCPIGAAHAGEEAVTYSPIYGASICPRCRKGVTRMIQNRICVSCYNREREVDAGVNARGNVPVQLLSNPPRDVTLTVVHNGLPRRRLFPRVTGPMESVVQSLRTTKGEMIFAPAIQMPAVRQGRLF